MSKYIQIDFDNTLCSDSNYGSPTKGAKEAMKRLKKDGFTIIISSARFASYWKGRKQSEEKKKIESWLQENGIKYDGLWIPDKLAAVAYVDDRAVPFKGDWQSVLDKIKNLNGRK
jgi:hypothetical protein